MKSFERLNKGCAISIRTDEIVDDAKCGATKEAFVVIEDQEGNEILKVDRELWDRKNEICGFTNDMKANILKEIMALYG